MRDYTILRNRNKQRQQRTHNVERKLDEITGLKMFPPEHRKSQAVKDIFAIWITNFNNRNGTLPKESTVKKFVQKVANNREKPHKDAWRLSYSMASYDQEELNIAEKLLNTAHQLAGQDGAKRKNEHKQAVYQARRIKMCHYRLKGDKQSVDTPKYFFPSPVDVAEEYCNWLLKCCSEWKYCSIWALSPDNGTWEKFEQYLNDKVLPRGLERD